MFLSAFTTKVAVYALARSFAGADVLVIVGTAMTFFPIFYAVLENDLRRVLGYSMVNQIGFMIAGIGIGTALAVNGAVAHAFADVIFKGLLFMSMGAVLTMTGRSKGTDLGGLYKTMPITATLCIFGAAAISAFPLFSAFVTKSMIMVAAIEEHHYIVWLFMLFASAGVLEHAGIKIPYFAFFAHDSGIRTKEPPKNMLIAMSIGAVLCVLIGMFPMQFYTLLPYEYGLPSLRHHTCACAAPAAVFWCDWLRDAHEDGHLSGRKTCRAHRRGSALQETGPVAGAFNWWRRRASRHVRAGVGDGVRWVGPAVGKSLARK